jgi:hypothetical protein
MTIQQLFYYNIPKWRVVVAVGAEWVALALVSCRPRKELEVIQGTLELLVDTNNAVLRQVVGFVAMRTMQARWLGVHVLHVPSALSAPENAIFMNLQHL